MPAVVGVGVVVLAVVGVGVVVPAAVGVGVGVHVGEVVPAAGTCACGDSSGGRSACRGI